MAAQAVAKAPEAKEYPLKSAEPIEEGSQIALSARLRTWREVIIAELLNLLEKRRYDACK
jgi:hypothetical protein